MSQAMLPCAAPGQVSTSPGPVATRLVDTHAHVFLPDLPMVAARRYAPVRAATLAQYLALLDGHGLGRGVLVQPSFLGTDNRYMLEALRAQPGRLRGVAVVDETVSAGELHALAAAGVVGMRLNLMGLPLPDLKARGWAQLLERINALGWHVELHVQAARLPDIVPALLAAGCRIVVDHFGRPDPALGVRDPGFGFLLRQADSARVWVKLSAPYRNGPAEGAALSARQAAAQLLRTYTPGRLMWGSDWPHTEHDHLTSYGHAWRWLQDMVADPGQRHTLLTETPSQLFQFKGDDHEPSV